jgi:decaprenyl-phosphate phosphoribosyltransferase
MKIIPYIRIMRPSHWFKNIFVLPGILLAFFFVPSSFSWYSLLLIFYGIVCVCLVASSNYVLNEILDGPYDVHHPEKGKRPVPSGEVNIPVAYGLWLFLAAAGIVPAFFICSRFGLAALALWVMGLLYNTPPVRLKDVPYADVLSESVNNPLRLALGWYSTGVTSSPPLSMILAYWMFGAFLMAVKRFAEYRHLNDAEKAANYRKSFSYYTQEKLLVSILYYASFFGMMSGVFITRYRLELVLASPVVIYAMAYYLHVGFKPDSPAQKPEILFRQKKLMILVLIAFVLCAALLYFDIAAFKDMLDPRLLPPASS